MVEETHRKAAIPDCGTVGAPNSLAQEEMANMPAYKATEMLPPPRPTPAPAVAAQIGEQSITPYTQAKYPEIDPRAFQNTLDVRRVPSEVSDLRMNELLNKFGGAKELSQPIQREAVLSQMQGVTFPPSKSNALRNAQGMTAKDVEALGYNPALHKGITFKETPETLEKLLKTRANRSVTYRTDAEIRKELDRLMREVD